MRTCEILILVTLFLRWVGYSFPPIKRSRWIDLIPSLTVLLTVIHLVVEKYRWQMAPAYALTLSLFLLSLPRIKREERPADKPPSRQVLLIVGFLLRLLVFAFVAALPVLLPVFRLPEPTGPHPVGTTKLHLVDCARPETFTPNPDDHRELVIQVWYPAQVEPDARLAIYLENVNFLYSHMSLVRTHSYLDASVSNAQSSYPVLIFSPGHVGMVEQNLTQMEELASHGYIVCGINHTYHAIVTAFPDGRVVPVDSTTANYYMTGSFPPRKMYAEDLRIWTDDTLFLIKELESIQAGERESTFVGKLDMARLGIFGVSFGGTTAVQACSMDALCQAVVVLDGGMPTDYVSSPVDAPLKKPFMFMSNENEANRMRQVLSTAESTAYRATVLGAKHFNFFPDIALYSPVFKFIKAFGPIDKPFGAIDKYRMIKIINDYTLAFFDKHLKGEMSPLLDGPSPDYPDIEFQSNIP
jgi:predicted dienelactone hydrolase